MSAASTKCTSMGDVFPHCFPFNHAVCGTIWGYLDVVTLGTLSGVDKVFQERLEQENGRIQQNTLDKTYRQFSLTGEGITAHVIKPFFDKSGYVVGVTISRKRETNEVWLLDPDFQLTERVEAPERPCCIYVSQKGDFVSFTTSGDSYACTLWSREGKPRKQTQGKYLPGEFGQYLCSWSGTQERFLARNSCQWKSFFPTIVLTNYKREELTSYIFPSPHKDFFFSPDKTALVFGGDETGIVTAWDFRATKNEVSGVALFQVLKDGTLVGASGNRILPSKAASLKPLS